MNQQGRYRAARAAKKGLKRCTNKEFKVQITFRSLSTQILVTFLFTSVALEDVETQMLFSHLVFWQLNSCDARKCKLSTNCLNLHFFIVQTPFMAAIFLAKFEILS